MSIVGETLAAVRSLETFKTVTRWLWLEPTRRQKQIPVVPPRLQGICHGNILPMFSFFVVADWRYHRQAGRRTRVLGGMATQIFVTKKFSKI